MASTAKLLAIITTTGSNMIDTHSHVLPGIDDGSKSFKESLDILRGLFEQGITELFCTPHYIAETKHTSPRKENEKLLNELQKKADEQGIDIKLHLGNEIYIDRNIAKFLRAKKISPLSGQGKHLLIELPMSGEFAQYEDIFKDLQQKGWTVILAHPERYHTTQKDYGIIKNLHNYGILFQCNLGRLIGQYGKHAQKTVRKIAKDNLIFCLGTDIHRRRDYNEIAKAIKKLNKDYTTKDLNKILFENAQTILKMI